MNPNTEILAPVPVETLGSGLLVTRQSLTAVKTRIGLLQEFFSNQLTRGLDYGWVPGSDKPSLFQPGAQKLAQLFGLVAQKVPTHKEIDHEKNYAMFSYRADIFYGKEARLVAQCEGSCNSKEKKYATRAVYEKKTKKFLRTEDTPICDVMNTLQKMAQKRAYVGGILEATGGSYLFTQDIDTPEDAAALGLDQRTARKVVENVEIPKVTSARRVQSQEIISCTKVLEDGELCGRKMMIDRFDAAKWYCAGCGSHAPRQQIH